MNIKPIILSLACCLCCATGAAQTGQWRDYPAYYEPKQIQQSSASSVFVLASGALYQYNPQDESIRTYSKVNGLSDCDISHIAWSKQARRLLIVYTNANMDLLTEQGDCFSLSDLYRKSTTLNKTINNLWLTGTEALVATGFGVVAVDVEKGVITHTYNLGHNIRYVARVTEATATKNFRPGIYAMDDKWVTYYGVDSLSLENPQNWSIHGSDMKIYQADKTDWNTWIEQVRTLKPGGPKYNNFGVMKFLRGRLLTADNGSTVSAELYLPAVPQEYNPETDEWLIYEELPDSLRDDMRAIDVMDITEDPLTPGHVYASNRSALVEYQDGKILRRLTPHNTAALIWRLDSTQAQRHDRNLRVETICYDQQGQLWMLNSSAGSMSLGRGNQLLMLDRQGQWHDYSQALPKTEDDVSLRSMTFDSRGLIWFNNMHWINPQTYCFNPETGKLLKTIGNDVVNEDGATLTDYYRQCLAEDMQGNVWIGTTAGPVQVDAEFCRPDVADVPYLTQVKVARNDGSGLADYLMSGASVTAICIDGAGRKWLGTGGAGIYLISADCQTQIEHFTQDNSPLISDNIRALSLDNATGMLYIGTDLGLCSYHADATTANQQMSSSQLVAYPNPVTPEYTGLITITGFTLDADVKILNAAGRLIAQGRSNGGTFTWDGRDSHGHRVASGVYMVAAATSEGQKGAVGKIAIVR